MAESSFEHELGKLRRFKAAPERVVSLREHLLAEARRLRKLQKGVGVVAAAWEAVVPRGLVERTELVGISRGVLTVKAADAATKYELERVLRAGGQAAVVRSAPVALRRVKVVL